MKMKLHVMTNDKNTQCNCLIKILKHDAICYVKVELYKRRFLLIALYGHMARRRDGALIFII